MATDMASQSKKRRAAVFLACIGTEAYETFQVLDFEDESHREDIDKVITAFQKHFVGEVNVTYERYVFNKRVQETGEPFDIFVSELRKLVRTCDYGGLEESMVRDRIVVGIRDDATRRKLLQTRKLTLQMTVDICKASEVAFMQLRAMTSTTDDVNTVDKHSEAGHRSKSRTRQSARQDNRQGNARRKCKYCGREHEMKKDACPAYGKTCNKCSGKNHFASVCKSRSEKHSQVCNVDDEELLAIETDRKRLYSRLEVEGKTVRFLLDCGATVNLLPISFVQQINPGLTRLTPATSTLRMFDNTALQTAGMLKARVQHPTTGHMLQLDFYVATMHSQAILGLDACLQFELLSVIEENLCATDVTSSRLTRDVIMQKYSDIFQGQGTLAGDVHLEVDLAVPPVQMPIRRLPVALQDQVQAELAQLVQDGIIKPVTEPTPWISALLVVRKPNGKVRLCIDPKPLNKALKRSHYKMSTIDDVLPHLRKAKVFSTIDARNGFWHLRLDEASSMLTTFGTPFGRFRWLRLAFGLSPAPEIFQARMHEALSGLQGIDCIADDVLVHGSGDTLQEAQADHDKNLLALLDRCREKDIRLSPDKLQLDRTRTTFMGHELTSSGVRPDRRKVIAIQQMPAPTDRAGVQRLVGMATYLAKFCPNFSDVTAPIRQLIPPGNEFHWDAATHGAAFDKLKHMLVNAPVLRYYDVTMPVVVQCDASQGALGAVILQGNKPVEYASRTMSPTERDTYAQIEKELLSVLFALERFDTYVYGKHIIVENDHKPLVAINKKSLATAPKRLQKMLIRLQRYDYDIIYRPGSQMLVADALSRACDDATTDASSRFSEELAAVEDDAVSDLTLVASQQTIDIISKAAQDDEQYCLLKHQTMLGWPDAHEDLPVDLKEYRPFADELSVSQGLVFKGHRVVIPRGARQYILDRIHASHIGMNGCIRRAREIVFYPGITSDIKKLVGQCDVCRKYDSAAQKEPLLSHTPPTRPWEKVGVDIFTFSDHDYLITVDYLSGYFEVDRLPTKRIQDVVYVLKQHFARHGLPSEVVSDNSPFGAAEFARFAVAYDFKHTTSSPRYPQSNGRVENSVKTAKQLMAKAADTHQDPFLALLAWRNTPSEQLHQSPAHIMFGRRTRTNLPSANTMLKSAFASEATTALANAKGRQAYYYNKHARERLTLEPGQTVRMKFDDQSPWRKAEVLKELPYRSYEVQTEDGQKYRRTSKHLRFSNEPPLVYNDGSDDTLTSSRPSPSLPTPDRALTKEEPKPLPSSQPPRPQDQPYTTRSGRHVRKPIRFQD